MTANLVTFIRILISIALIGLNPLSVLFKGLYLATGISDMLDGAIARATNTTSTVGARLDSLADLVFCMVALYKILPFVTFQEHVPALIIFIVAIRGISAVLCKLKFGQVAMMHTLGNKMTGLALFIFFFFMESSLSGFYQYMLCFMGCASALEELMIHATSNDLDLNRRRLWR